MKIFVHHVGPVRNLQRLTDTIGVIRARPMGSCPGLGTATESMSARGHGVVCANRRVRRV